MFLWNIHNNEEPVAKSSFAAYEAILSKPYSCKMAECRILPAFEAKCESKGAFGDWPMKMVTLTPSAFGGLPSPIKGEGD